MLLGSIKDPKMKLKQYKPDWQPLTQLTLINEIANFKYKDGAKEIKYLIKSEELKQAVKNLSQNFE